jgi:hypothetical protein
VVKEDGWVFVRIRGRQSKQNKENKVNYEGRINDIKRRNKKKKYFEKSERYFVIAGELAHDPDLRNRQP